jgi:hypothetical protein
VYVVEFATGLCADFGMDRFSLSSGTKFPSFSIGHHSHMLFIICYLIIRLESMADDQYREYGYSEKEREAPGYLRTMFNALSGVKDNGDMFLVSGEDEDSQEEAAGTEIGDAIDFNESRRPKQLPEKEVTDGKYVKDNSSESSGRISHPGPKSYNFDASGFENFPLPTDPRGMFTSTVRPRLGPEPLFSSRLALPREESSGGDDFAGGAFVGSKEHWKYPQCYEERVQEA